jgi:CrcB protein
MVQYIIVFLGAGLGGALRHAVNLAVADILGAGLGYGTLFVNIAGSLAMGVLVALLAVRTEFHQPWRLFLGTGLLGGFTTFSAFSLDAILLIERRQLALASLYIALSVAGSLAALIAGLALVRRLA